MSHLFITIPLLILSVWLVCLCTRDFHREGMQRVRKYSGRF